jgi:signal transduction histidine kinase
MFKTVVLDYQKVDAVALVKEVVENYRKPATKKHIKIHVSSQEPEMILALDPTYGLQIIDNLVSNSVKYTWRGKEINILINRNDTHTRISFYDQGPGLNEQDLKKIFGKYQKLSAKPTGGEASTGLGLSIVKKYVEAMNGKVWAENQEQEGAVFIVEFPTNG